MITDFEAFKMYERTKINEQTFEYDLSVLMESIKLENNIDFSFNYENEEEIVLSLLSEKANSIEENIDKLLYIYEKKTKRKKKRLKIKRADGTYSRRGLWDNIRDAEGSGKRPSKEMKKQIKKIKEEDK